MAIYPQRWLDLLLSPVGVILVLVTAFVAPFGLVAGILHIVTPTKTPSAAQTAHLIAPSPIHVTAPVLPTPGPEISYPATVPSLPPFTLTLQVLAAVQVPPPPPSPPHFVEAPVVSRLVLVAPRSPPSVATEVAVKPARTRCHELTIVAQVAPLTVDLVAALRRACR